MARRFTQGLTRLLLAAALLSTMSGAVAASASSPRGGRAACPMSRLHGCCKRARQNLRAPGVAPAARLCCIVNCPQPAPAGANFTLQPSNGAATDPRPPATPATPATAAEHARAYAPPFKPSHSPPAYIRHAAFLI
jgi:hypothetical protein